MTKTVYSLIARPQSPFPTSKKKKDGGGERDRTDDLRLAKPALSQLSYTPVVRLLGPVAR
jgi:hypothetical protein